METKNIIIIAVIAVIICIATGAMFGLLTKSVDYERIELMPNGTSIELPKDELKYEGEMNETGAKMWTFKQGALMTFNSEEAINARGLYGLGGALGFKGVEDMVLNHFEKREEIDGFTVYTIDGEKMGIEGRGMMYCIITKNNESHDNIVMAADDKDIVLHMAKSIEYKSVNSTKTASKSTATASSSSNSNDNDVHNDKNKYSEEDLKRANQEGYDSGYSDGQSDSNDYDDSSSIASVETTTDSSSPSSSDSEGGSSSDSGFDSFNF